MDIKKLIEDLSDLEHDQWAHWTGWMLDNLTDENILRWREQIKTPYVDLTEKEKDSDREWARKVVAILCEHGVLKKETYCDMYG